ncbi:MULTISPECIES: branched-chain amino acid ABC transporter permease [unclassified Geodermatophilus]|uniref:branched-chain amino acid ABC transporter permease n=1 Tax=unclassified Geodermatophilus TaxID=2637632 RepID=UPI003EEE54B8
MTTLVEYLVIGLSLGAIYGLMAVPLSLVFSTTGTMDLAIGGYAVAGGLTGATVGGLGGALAGLALGAAAGGLMGVVFLVLRSRPSGDHMGPVLASVGLLFALVALSQAAFGLDPVFVPFLEGVWEIGPLRIRPVSVLILAVVLLVGGLLVLGLRRTPLGRWMRACASSPRDAELMGIPVRLVQLSAFVLSGLLGALGGLLLVASRGLAYDAGLPLALLGLGALIIFGMRGPVTAIVGGLVLGVVESLGAGYLPATVVPIVPLLFIVAVLASGRFDVRVGVQRP